VTAPNAIDKLLLTLLLRAKFETAKVKFLYSLYRYILDTALGRAIHGIGKRWGTQSRGDRVNYSMKPFEEL
jgi:hypothetical protein